MPTKAIHIRHVIGGGWATDASPAVTVVPNDDGVVVIPNLLEARNVRYSTLGGGVRKSPGTEDITGASLSNSMTLDAYDYWRMGTTGNPIQELIVRNISVVRAAPGNDYIDSFVSISGGTVFFSDAVSSFSQFDDLLIYADDTSLVPQEYDGTTWQDLQGSPPNFGFSVTHLNRTWAAGVDANPSRLFFSAFVAPQDWIGGGSGNIDINPNDGDRIMGLASFKGQLIVFKGPNNGSIHRIVGSSPTGADAFALDSTLPRGLPLVSHRTIFEFRGDLGFMTADGRVHTLATTAAFGDFDEAALTRPIDTYINDEFNFSQLRFAKATTLDHLGLIIFTVPISSNAAGSARANTILTLDYRFADPRWARWDDYSNPTFVTKFIDQLNNFKPGILMGIFIGTEGGSSENSRVFRLGEDDLNNNDASIDFQIITPHLNYASGQFQKTITGIGLGLTVENDNTINVLTRNESGAQQTTAIKQTDGAVLGTASNGTNFILNTARLAAELGYQDRFADMVEGGEFSSIQFEISDDTLDVDVNIHSILARYETGAESWGGG